MHYRKMKKHLWILAGWLVLNTVVLAAERYVVVPGTAGGTNVGPYTNWTIAATQIQWAVDTATNGETVWVSNGTYNLTNQITLTNAITLQSFHGTNLTFVNGNFPAYTNRCFYITNNDSVIDGFTITNGYYISMNTCDGGGGVKLDYKGTLRNCVIKGNISSNDANFCGGGGVYLYSGGMVSNCVIVSNTAFGVNESAPAAGGGIHLYLGGLVCDSLILNNSGGFGGGARLRPVPTAVMSNCTVAGNTARTSAGGVAGGLILNSLICNNISSNEDGGLGGASVQIINSVISNNTARTSAGGIHFWYGSFASNCIITGNSAGTDSGGVYIQGDQGNYSDIIVNSVIYNNKSLRNGAGIRILTSVNQKQSMVRNCLIYNNTNQSYSGGGIYITSGAGTAIVQSCTIAGNEAGTLGGGLYLKGTNQIENCIIYGNVATNDAYDDVYNDSARNTNDYYYCCAPTNLAVNQGNITNNPLFAGAGNWRLAANSPCINTGTNQSWMTGTFDLDGRQRIRYGTVDMGAYELIYDGTIYTLH